MNYDNWKSYWEDIYTEGNNCEYQPSTPTTQEEADALAAIEDAPEPEPVDWEWLDEHAPF